MIRRRCRNNLFIPGHICWFWKGRILQGWGRKPIAAQYRTVHSSKGCLLGKTFAEGLTLLHLCNGIATCTCAFGHQGKPLFNTDWSFKTICGARWQERWCRLPDFLHRDVGITYSAESPMSNWNLLDELLGICRQKTLMSTKFILGQSQSGLVKESSPW